MKINHSCWERSSIFPHPYYIHWHVKINPQKPSNASGSKVCELCAEGTVKDDIPRECKQSQWTMHLDVSENNGTKSSILIGVFHYKPSILKYHYFWKHPFSKAEIKPNHAHLFLAQGASDRHDLFSCFSRTGTSFHPSNPGFKSRKRMFKRLCICSNPQRCQCYPIKFDQAPVFQWYAFVSVRISTGN